MEKRSPKALAAFIIAGPLIFLIYLYFFVGFNDILEVFRQINPYDYLFCYSLTIIALIISTLFYSMSWNELMKALSINVSVKKSFVYCWLGLFIDLVVPLETISGEITRVYLVHRETGDPPGKIVASVAGHRIITTFITLGSLLSSSLFILERKISAEMIILMLATISGSLLLISVLIYLSLKEDAAEKLIDFLIKSADLLTRGKFNFSEIRGKAQRNLSYFCSGFRSFGVNHMTLVKSVSYSFLAWLLHLSIYFLVFYALGFSEISGKVYETMVVYSVSMAVQSTPIALPLGLVEVVMTSLYALLGVPIAISGTATLLIRIVTFWLQIMIGYLIAQFMGIKNLLDRSRKETST